MKLMCYSVICLDAKSFAVGCQQRLKVMILDSHRSDVCVVGFGSGQPEERGDMDGDLQW